MKVCFSALCTFALLLGCSQSEFGDLSVQVATTDKEFTVQARGEILASESTSVTVPSVRTRMSLNLSWLIPEFSAVEEGDIVARLDDSELKQNQRQYSSQIANISWMIENLSRQSELGRVQIQHERTRVDGEADIAQTFADFDPRYFSRIEIIDAIGDLNFLNVEASFFDWQAETHDLRSEAESQQSIAELEASERNLEIYENTLKVIELRSPAEGTFIYAKTPWGEKLGRGSPAFPGSKIGLIPLKDKVKARLYVPKSEAQGITVGQEVRLRLDGIVEREIGAEVNLVAPIASIRTLNDPRKYFMVEATINESDLEGVRVGTGLQATVVLADVNDAVVLPSQAVFIEEDRAHVYVLDDGRLVSRSVDVGVRSPTLVEISSGLEEGEFVSLVAPETTVVQSSDNV